MKRTVYIIAILAVVAALVWGGSAWSHWHNTKAIEARVQTDLGQYFHSGGPGQAAIRDDLRRMGSNALPAQIAALSRTGYVGSAAEGMLLNDRNAAVALPEFVRLLGDKNAQTRRRAIGLVAHFIQPADTFALPALAGAMNDPDSSVRARAAIALGKFGPAAVTAGPLLIDAMDDTVTNVRIWAALTLSSVDTNQTPRAVRVLKDIVANGNSYDQFWAAYGLYKLSPQEPEIIPLWVSQLNSTNIDRGMRLNAINWLHTYGPAARSAVPDLLKIAHSGDLQKERAARAALAAIDPEALKQTSDEPTPLPGR